MDINEFIKLCKLHDWGYRSEVEGYNPHKELERQLITEVQQHPEWGELYLAFLNGVFE